MFPIKNSDLSECSPLKLVILVSFLPWKIASCWSFHRFLLTFISVELHITCRRSPQALALEDDEQPLGRTPCHADWADRGGMSHSNVSLKMAKLIPENHRKNIGKWWFDGILMDLPSGKRLHKYGKIHHAMNGATHYKRPLSIAMFDYKRVVGCKTPHEN